MTTIALTGGAPPTKRKSLLMKRQERKSHVRTVTRFCDEANIEETDELDMAEFIVAAHYLGVDADNDQLMEVFMEMEDAMDESDKDPKALIKEFVAKVNDMYGVKAMEGDDQKDDEVIEISPLDAFGEDKDWQDVQLAGMLSGAYEDQQLAVATRLLDTTALSIEQISEITGVAVPALEELCEEDSDWSDDEDEPVPMKKSEMVKLKSGDVGPAAGGGVEISPAALQKSLALTKADIVLLDELVGVGALMVEAKSKGALELLKKLKFAVEMTKRGQKSVKSAMRLRTQILSSVDVSRVVQQAVAREETPRYPQKYRVVISPGALVKEKKTLKSKEVAKIKIGVAVTVEDIQERRAQLSAPVAGWCSVKSGDGRTILAKEGTRSKEMSKAIQEERGRKTKILILKSVTTLSNATVERILEKSNWNLRRAIDAFYMTKYQTQQFMRDPTAATSPKKKKPVTDEAIAEVVSVKPKTGAAMVSVSTVGETEGEPSAIETIAEEPVTDTMPLVASESAPSKLHFWKHWKMFASQN